MDTSATTPSAPSAPFPAIELYTRTGCHLCADARAVLSDIAGGMGLPWLEVSIDDDDSLTERYGEEVPVVVVDGVQRDFWHIDPVRLQGILRRAVEEL